MDKKNIKIPHHGPIYAKGGVYGPITTPYVEEVGTIFRMLTEKIKVVEVLKDGKEVELTVTNFNKDNNVKPVEVKPAAPVTPPANTQQNTNVNKQQQNGKNNYQGKNNNQQQPKTDAQIKVEEKKIEDTLTPDAVETK